MLDGFLFAIEPEEQTLDAAEQTFVADEQMLVVEDLTFVA